MMRKETEYEPTVPKKSGCLWNAKSGKSSRRFSDNLIWLIDLGIVEFGYGNTSSKGVIVRTKLGYCRE